MAACYDTSVRAEPVSLLACAIAVGSLVGCAKPPREAPTAPSAEALLHHEPEEAQEHGPPAFGLDATRVRAEAVAILDAVAKARALASVRPVQVEVIDKPGIRKFAREAMYEDTTPEEIRLLGRIEASLGVVPIDAPIETILLDLLEEGILGFYDPKRETLFVGDFVPRAMLSMVVGHEIVHGLQDMHFDLERFEAPMPHRSDEESARRYLIEGDAQASYLAWMSGDQGLAQIDDGVLQALGDQTLGLAGFGPYPILARSLQMPYSDGTATIVRLAQVRGFAAVDELYAALPTTTEQMLHLDKLLAREPAIAVELDARPLAAVLALSQVWTDQIGEAALLAMLAETESASVARTAAAGWGGDVLIAFDDPESPLQVPTVVAAIAWDRPKDAEEFELAFGKYLHRIVGDAGTFVARRGELVVLGTHVPYGIDLDAVREAALVAAQVGAPGKPARKGAAQ